jgi:hypothetical protein
MPSWPAIYAWLQDPAHKADAKRFDDAEDMALRLMPAEIMEIADQSGGFELVQISEGHAVKRYRKEQVQRSALRIETRRWLLRCKEPRTYGEASLLKLGDNEGRKLQPVAFIFDLASRAVYEERLKLLEAQQEGETYDQPD